MKRFILALILGLAIGYAYGYQQGSDGDPSIPHQIMNKFGADRLKANQDSANANVEKAADDASK